MPPSNLVALAIEHCKPMLSMPPRNRDWYEWKVDEDLPQGIYVKGSSDYERATSLREALNTELSKNPNRREELTKFYIERWGGVNGNKPETMKIYASNTPSSIIERRAKGVASWSKALTILDPATYAIYDARVAFSLNALQLTAKIEKPLRFPILQSQNTLLKRTSELLKSKTKGWDRLDGDVFYSEYLKLLNTVAKEMRVTIGDIEMCLFAKAEELATKILQK